MSEPTLGLVLDAPIAIDAPRAARTEQRHPIARLANFVRDRWVGREQGVARLAIQDTPAHLYPLIVAIVTPDPIEEVVEVYVFLDSHDGACRSQILFDNGSKIIRGFPLTMGIFEINALNEHFLFHPP
jgi:hypothetical protein